ncbi:transposase [Mycobacterium sp. MBM]|nr:transposase [Mycobacterium sp. MBM]
MLSVLLYAYCTGERSSRRIERRLVEDVAVRVVAANQRPDHATLARFRRRHQDAIAALFGQVLGLCVTAGLVDAGVVSIDGTKIAADASFFANRDHADLSAELARSIGADRAAEAARRVAEHVLAEAEQIDAAEDECDDNDQSGRMPAQWAGGRDRRSRIRAALAELESQKATDFQTRMAERARKESESGRKLTGPKPSEQTARRARARRANITDPDSRIIPQASKGVLQGYNAQAAATTGQIVLAAEISNSTNDQTQFVPLATAVTDNLMQAGHRGGAGVFLADAGYWSSANGTADVGAQVLIATRKSPWRKADKPDDDKLAVLARVNRGELSQRQAGAILGVSYTWVRDMTKRYFGRDGQRVTRSAEPEPQEWIPVIERLVAGEISRRAASDQLDVSPARVNTMLAHVRDGVIDPAVARNTMNDKLSDPENAKIYRKRGVSIEPVFGNIKANLGFRKFSLRGHAGVHSEWRLICTVHNLLKLQHAIA